ncbi:MAG TPA: hypothetical protein VEH04_07495 [Verrucomicrobiae bacterium]|nr:hypothetical protein [Verrucomicrobiae bacterium]
MNRNHEIILLFLAALIVAGATFRQERETHKLRRAIAELTSDRIDEIAAVPADNHMQPADMEAVRRELGEVLRLRAEVAQLRQEKVETAALQASIEKLTADISAIAVRSPQLMDFIVPSSNVAPQVSQAITMAESSPAAAAQWVAALPEGEDKNQATMAVIERWLRSDPAAAAGWTTEFPEGPLRDAAMSRVAREWGLHDWNATSEWLEKLPVGSSRDAAIGAFVISADGYDIRLAVEWANLTEDPQSRARRLESTAQRWLREDHATARAWLEKAQLPAGMAERLLSGR